MMRGDHPPRDVDRMPLAVRHVFEHRNPTRLESVAVLAAVVRLGGREFLTAWRKAKR